MPSVDNNGISVHYELVGSGRPLVLQHGFTMSLKRWHIDGYVDALSADYKVILIDARGHGGSAKPHDAASYSTELMASDVLAVLDVLGIEHTAYWGYSMGAAIGFELAKVASARVSAFILGGMHPYGREIKPVAEFVGDDPAAFADAFLRRIGVDPASVPPVYRQLLLENDFQALAACQQSRPTQEAALANMAMPVLMYVGGADLAHEAAQRAANTLPDCTFLTVGDLDHARAFRESAKVLPDATRFLARAYPTGD